MASLSEKLTFPGSAGHALAARLDLPEDGTPKAYALFAHCFTCSKDSVGASRVSQALAARGIATLRFDFTGLGSSDGDFSNTDFSSNIGDLLAAIHYLRETGRAPSILIGHSLGGAAILAAAGQVPEARAVVTIAAPFDPAHVAHNFGDSTAEIEAKGEAVVNLGGRPFTIRKQFLEDIAAQDQAARIAALHKPLLIFHAPRDETVGIDNAEAIYKAAKHPKSFVSLDGADHLLTKRADATYVADVLAAWASRFVDAEAEREGAPGPANGIVEVSETGKGKFSNLIRVGKHVLPADEPLSVEGGLDTGPGPYDYLLAALGACTAMTIRMYAAMKGIQLAHTKVELSHEKIHAKDCAECETREGKIDRITRKITLEGELSAEQRAKLMEIADKCPVHRTLHSEIRIETEEAH